MWHGDTNAHTVPKSSEEARQKPPPLTPAHGSDEVELRGDLNHQNLGKQLSFLEPAEFDNAVPFTSVHLLDGENTLIQCRWVYFMANITCSEIKKAFQ